MAGLSYEEIMGVIHSDEGISDKLIKEVVKEMGLNNYPDEEVERMHLENDLNSTLIEWIDSAVQNMSLQELRDVTKKLENEELTELRVRKP